MRWRHAFRASPLLVIPLLACNGEDPVAPSFMTVNPPASLTATAMAYNLIDLTWRDNASNETGFEVHRSSTGPGGVFALLVTTGPGGTNYSDYSVSASTQYCYKARTLRTTGRKDNYSDFSNVACATTPALPVPAAPSAASAVPGSSTYLTLTWLDNSTDETGFRIELSLDAGGTWQPIGSPTANVRSFTEYGLTPDQARCYRVFAVNTFGSSQPSNVDCTAPPLGPDQFTATGASGPAIDLAWQDRSSVEDGYEVRRVGLDGEGSTITVLAAGAHSYHDAAIAADTRYAYSVAARKDGGYSDFSSATAMSASAPPAAPTSVDAYPQNSSSTLVYWSGQSTNVNQFRIERSSDGGASWVTAGTVDWNQTAFGEAGLTSDQRQCYQVIAINSGGESAPSNVDCATPPAAPSDFSASPVSAAGIELTWTDLSNAEDGYEVWLVSYDCGYYFYCYPSYVSIAVLDPNTTSYTISGLDPSYFYTFVVAARKDGGYSDVSYEAGSYPGPQAP